MLGYLIHALLKAEEL
ncbi:hypothetical protein ACHAC9_01955 [Massilia sp. CMS3.1]